MAQDWNVDVEGSRYEDQKQQMEKIRDTGLCPFCPQQLSEYHKEPIIKEGTYWLVTKNQWPYAHTKVHLLLIAKTHVTSLTDLAPEAGKELIELAAWAIQEFQIPGGGLVLRFGASEYSAGSVAHLHAQLVMPDLDDPEYEPVRIKIGKSRH